MPTARTIGLLLWRKHPRPDGSNQVHSAHSVHRHFLAMKGCWNLPRLLVGICIDSQVGKLSVHSVTPMLWRTSPPNTQAKHLLSSCITAEFGHAERPLPQAHPSNHGQEHTLASLWLCHVPGHRRQGQGQGLPPTEPSGILSKQGLSCPQRGKTVTLVWFCFLGLSAFQLTPLMRQRTPLL